MPELQREGSTGFPPFLKCATLKKGATVIIESPFSPPVSPKIQSPAIANVNYEGSTYTMGINWSTIQNLQKAFGVNTDEWVGKAIEFKGLVKLGKGNGYLWVASERTN